MDARGDEPQRAALSNILLGRLEGDDVLRLPWVRKPSDLLEVRTSAIEMRHGPGGYQLRVGEAVALAATRAVPTDESVTCVVPGHHEPGTELYADRFSVGDAPFEWELAGNCAFASNFAYRSSRR